MRGQFLRKLVLSDKQKVSRGKLLTVPSSCIRGILCSISETTCSPRSLAHRYNRGAGLHAMRYNRDGSPVVRTGSVEIRWLVSATWSVADHRLARSTSVLSFLRRSVALRFPPRAGYTRRSGFSRSRRQFWLFLSRFPRRGSCNRILESRYLCLCTNTHIPFVCKLKFALNSGFNGVYPPRGRRKNKTRCSNVCRLEFVERAVGGKIER